MSFAHFKYIILYYFDDPEKLSLWSLHLLCNFNVELSFFAQTSWVVCAFMNSWVPLPARLHLTIELELFIKYLKQIILNFRFKASNFLQNFFVLRDFYLLLKKLNNYAYM